MSEIDQIPNTRKEKPYSNKTRIEEYSTDDVDCYRGGKKKYFFVPNQDEVPNDVSRALDYAYRRGRVMTLNNQCDRFDIQFSELNDSAWPVVTLKIHK